MSAIGVLLFIVFILLAIGIHELGHFATAKWFGIKVERFFIGFGPKIWSKRRGETEYGVAALPLGGYVRISGMNPMEEIPPEDLPRTFKAKPKWQRAIVLSAGSITHFVVALFIIAGVLTVAGQPDPERVTTTIQSVDSQSGQPTPAQHAGIRRGDVLVSIDGIPVRTWDEAVRLIHERPGKVTEVGVLRNGKPVTVRVELASENPQTHAKVGFLGVSPKPVVKNLSFPAAIAEAGRQVGSGMKSSVVMFGKVFTPGSIGRLFQTAAGNRPRSVDDPTGVVGIGKVSGDLARSGDFATLFLMIAGFNIFVGVINLLPLPPLDGGHLAVLGAEAISRREVDMRKLIPITAMVLSIFATLFVLLLYLDIVKPIPIGPG